MDKSFCSQVQTSLEMASGGMDIEERERERESNVFLVSLDQQKLLTPSGCNTLLPFF
jgi:hypothetical protein